MYIPGRYDNYTSRFDVYLFTLRDWCGDLIGRYGGKYLERADMPIHTGYLIEFTDYEKAVAFLKAQASSSSGAGDTKVLTLPALSGNTLPVYATVNEYCKVVYIGLSSYDTAIDEFIMETATISFDANTGTGTMSDVVKLVGDQYEIPDSSFTAPSQKEFSKWNTAADGSGTDYAPEDVITVEADLTLYAIWVDE